MRGKNTAENGAAPVDKETERTSTLTEELHRQFEAAPWFLCSAAVHVVFLALLMAIPVKDKIQKPRSRTVVITIPVDKTPPPQPVVDISEVNPADDQRKLLTDLVNTPIDADQNHSDQSPAGIAANNLAANLNPASMGNIEAEMSFFGVGEGAQSEPGDLKNGDEEPFSDDIFPLAFASTNAAPGVTSNNRGTTDMLPKTLKDLARVANKGTATKGICLTWLLDKSPSMKKQQLAIARQAKEIQELLTDGGERSMLSSVVVYDSTPTLFTNPTSDTSAITQAINNVPKPEGGIENVAQAIVYSCEQIMAKKEGWTRIIVVLSDETGDDWCNWAPAERAGGRTMTWGDLAQQKLCANQTKLFVISAEAPFQNSTAQANYTDEQGLTWSLPVNRGPETAQLEVPITLAGIPSQVYDGNRNLSGYGSWDFSYQAYASKGAYFILDERLDSRKPLTASEKMRFPLRIDWDTMEKYKPTYVARANYEAKMKETRQGQACMEIIKTLASAKDCRLPVIADIGRPGSYPPSNYGKNLQEMRNRAKLLNSLLKQAKTFVAKDEELAKATDRRQIANLDLHICALLAGQIMVDNFLSAYENYKGPTPPIPAEIEPGTAADQMLAITHKSGTELSAEDQEFFDRKMAELDAACDEVIRRHRNTPWAAVAHWSRLAPAEYGRPSVLKLTQHPKPTPNHLKRPIDQL